MSEASHALAIREAPGLPTSGEWGTMVEMARALVPTGFLPASIKTPEQAVAIILKGRELRVPPMQALSQIVVVQGKPTCSAELMLALIYRDHGDLAVVVEESTPEACRVAYRRRAWDGPRAFSFTLEDARRANLAGKDTWKAYPQAMLRARCISAVARLAFPDSIGGMYTPEELGAEVRVTDEGVVEVLPPAIQPVEAVRVVAAPTPIRPEAEHLEEWERERQPAEGAPGDDVDALSGQSLVEACDRMRRRLNAAGVDFAPLPDPRTNASLRRWWNLAAAALAARP